MPNWCANRLQVIGSSSDIERVRTFFNGGTSTPFDADFFTPWAPPAADVLTALSERYSVTVTHWYAEAGCDFCGYAAYTNGIQTEAFFDSLEWSEDEDGCFAVTGPDWIIGNVASYGG